MKRSIDPNAERAVERVAPAHIRSQLDRATERLTHDPAGAVTLARTVLESTFKHIAVERQQDSQQNETAVELLNIALEVLGFPSHAKAAATGSPAGLDKVVKGLRTVIDVIEGLSQFRNRYSDAHGHVKSRTPVSRDARFAVAASEAVRTVIDITLPASPGNELVVPVPLKFVAHQAERVHLRLGHLHASAAIALPDPGAPGSGYVSPLRD